MSQFTEITVHTTSAASELVADAMWNYTDFGVNICDVNDIVALQRGEGGVYWDYMDDSLVWNDRADVLVKCYVAVDRAGAVRRALRADLAAMVQNAAGAVDFGTLEDTERTVDGDAWLEVWKEHFRPIHLQKIVVVPEWIDYAPSVGEKIIRLDSNMAFGTGEHETTAMCVEYLQAYVGAGSTVVDVGCGSGILGIAAVLLGAQKAYLNDIDPVAVDSAKHNAALNGVSDRVQVVHSGIPAGGGEGADVVVANITAEVLVSLAESVSACLKRGGALILSGILHDRVERVKSAYEAQGMSLERERSQGEWHAMVLRRN